MKRNCSDAMTSTDQHPSEIAQSKPVPRVSHTQRLCHSHQSASEAQDPWERFAPLPCVLPDDGW